MPVSKPSPQESQTRILLFTVLMLGFVLRLWAVNTEAHQSPDTFQYARQTSALLQSGIGSLREEAARFVADPAMAAIPSPSRSLWLITMAAWSKLTNTAGVTAVVSFACFADMLALAALALLSSEILSTGAAVAATLLYAVSPAALSIARHGWGDSFTSLLGLLGLLFAQRALTRPASRWPIYALGLLGGLTFAVKETAFIQSTLVVIVTAAVFFARRQQRESLSLLTTFAGSFAVTLACNAFVLGGFSIVLRLTGIGRDTHGLVPYAVAYQNGSPAQWLQALFLTDPIVFTLGLAGAALALVHFRRTLAEYPVLLSCIAICITLVLLPMFGKGLCNVRWMSPAYAPACILAAFALHACWKRLAARNNASASRLIAVAAFALVLFAAVGIWRYTTLIAVPDLQDLSLKMILLGHN